MSDPASPKNLSSVKVNQTDEAYCLGTAWLNEGATPEEIHEQVRDENCRQTLIDAYALREASRLLDSQADPSKDAQRFCMDLLNEALAIQAKKGGRGTPVSCEEIKSSIPVSAAERDAGYTHKCNEILRQGLELFWNLRNQAEVVFKAEAKPSDTGSSKVPSSEPVKR